MPGTIQVTVLEFKGVSSSSKPSAKSLKVSMGKRHYQTWDKGDFSFPISKLRDDLVVALVDAGGNEIAHAEIRTMQIIEKGYWDEVFSINGGGHVHMKLQFVLSDDERNRIRIMRETVMKKKLQTNPNINLRLSETVSSISDYVETTTKNEQKVSDVVRPKVNDSQAGSSSISSADSPFTYQKEGERMIESAIPNATDGSQGSPFSPGKRGMNVKSPQVDERQQDEKIEIEPVANIRSGVKEDKFSSKLLETETSDKNSSAASKSSQDFPIQKSRKGPSDRTPSNVKKMISAFENSQLQDVKSMRKTSSVPSQLNRFKKEDLLDERQSKAVVFSVPNNLKKAPSIPGKEGLLENRESKSVVLPSDESSTKFKDYDTGYSQQTATIVQKTEPSEAPKESASNEPNVNEHEKSLADLTRQLTSEEATSSGRMVNSSEPSIGEGSGSQRGTGLKSSMMVDNILDNLNSKPKSLENYKEECYSAQSSGMWIFPDNSRQLCITTAGKQEAESRQVNKISSQPEVQEKKTSDLPESGRGSSPHDSSNGLIGQVIKIAIILGFGVLVLLTRQKEPRKKHREENDTRLHVPDYADEIKLKPWP